MSSFYKFYKTNQKKLAFLITVSMAQFATLDTQAPLPCSCNQKLGCVTSNCGTGVVKCPHYLRNLRPEPMENDLPVMYTPYYVRTGISRYANWNNY